MMGILMCSLGARHSRFSLYSGACLTGADLPPADIFMGEILNGQ